MIYVHNKSDRGAAVLTHRRRKGSILIDKGETLEMPEEEFEIFKDLIKNNSILELVDAPVVVKEEPKEEEPIEEEPIEEEPTPPYIPGPGMPGGMPDPTIGTPRVEELKKRRGPKPKTERGKPDA